MRVLFFTLSEKIKVYKVIYNSSDQTKRYEKEFILALERLLPSLTVNNSPVESENEDIQKGFKLARILLNMVEIKNLLTNRILKLKQIGIILCIPYLLKDCFTVYNSTNNIYYVVEQLQQGVLQRTYL